MTAHLENRDGALVQDMFMKHTDLFSSTPGIAKVGKHPSSLKEGHGPGRLHPCDIPKALRGEVTNQMEELLSLGLIYECES